MNSVFPVTLEHLRVPFWTFLLMVLQDNDLILKDYSDNEVYLKYKKNVLYNLDKQRVMKERNEKLIETVH